MTTHIRPATTADAPRLSEFAARTFSETFAKDNTPEDMARYLAESFSPGKQAEEIADADGVVLLAEEPGATGDGALIGYVHLVAGQPPEAVQGPGPIELKRLYVASAWKGRGVAQA